MIPFVWNSRKYKLNSHKENQRLPLTLGQREGCTAKGRGIIWGVMEIFFIVPVSSLHMCIHPRNSNELCTLNRYSLLYLNFVSVKLIFKRKLECSPLGLSYFIQHLLVSLMKYFRKKRRKEGLMRHIYVSHFFNRREENYGKKFS